MEQPNSILPPNVSDLERDLELALARIEAVAIPIADLWDPWRCPLDILPFLAWALSVDMWHSDWPESVKRQVVSSSLNVHRVKGTRRAVESALASLGLDTTLVEWFETTPSGAPGTFHVDVFVSDQGLSDELLSRARRAIEDSKRASAHYSLTMNLSRDLAVSVAAAPVCGLFVTVQPWYASELVGETTLTLGLGNTSLSETTVYPGTNT